MGNYDDILHLPHHVSKKHPPMPLLSRAAQFSPFDALTGYGDRIRETSRLTDDKVSPDENLKVIMDRKLRILEEHLPEHPVITVTFFVPDDRKEGGSYQTVTETVRKIDHIRRTIIFSDRSEIFADDITDLSGELFGITDF